MASDKLRLKIASLVIEDCCKKVPKSELGPKCFGEVENCCWRLKRNRFSGKAYIIGVRKISVPAKEGSH